MTVAHVYPSTLRSDSLHRGWQPQHMSDRPQPPPPDTREAELAQLAAQEKLGHDGKRQRVRARRTVDPFGGLEKWKIVESSPCPRPVVAVAEHETLLAVPHCTNFNRRPAVHALKSELPDRRDLSRWRQFSFVRLGLTCPRVAQLLPPHAYNNASTSYCSRYAHTSTNKIRCPVNIVKVGQSG